ncbi:MAG: hypothetical protein PHD88_04930 [Firmicutes bacterium]|nr:hypothetical protein [Bacillota bacterium]MDD4264562.1 hypothetical protein [Bacillota bacterium]MDD4693730.1 hypothetical protein [Bacillota bacterium]
MQRTKRQMLIGGIMLFIGWIVLLGMVVELIPTLVWLSFISYGLTLVGFVIGIIGVVTHVRINRRDEGK